MIEHGVVVRKGLADVPNLRRRALVINGLASRHCDGAEPPGVVSAAVVARYGQGVLGRVFCFAGDLLEGVAEGLVERKGHVFVEGLEVGDGDGRVCGNFVGEAWAGADVVDYAAVDV